MARVTPMRSTFMFTSPVVPILRPGCSRARLFGQVRRRSAVHEVGAGIVASELMERHRRVDASHLARDLIRLPRTKRQEEQAVPTPRSERVPAGSRHGASWGVAIHQRARDRPHARVDDVQGMYRVLVAAWFHAVRLHGLEQIHPSQPSRRASTKMCSRHTSGRSAWINRVRRGCA